MNLDQPSYSAARSLWKAFWTFLACAFGLGAGLAANADSQFPQELSQFAHSWEVYLAPLIVAAVRAALDWRKHHND